MSKELKNLPEDIYALFDPEVDHVCSDDNLEAFAEACKNLLRARLKKAEPPSSPLRFSALGKPNRQIWFDAHPEEGTKEKLTPNTYIKFMYGDIIEQMLLFLAKEAGHSVEAEQAEVVCDGVLGHIDAIIDGVVVDVKSASPFGYKKFKEGRLTEDEDPFGYVAQLSGYADVLTPGKDAAWFANDKVAGDICISPLRSSIIRHHRPDERIKELKDVIASPEPPDRCYEDVPYGKSGNRKLDTGCSYCAHKYRCWPGLRAFAYSTGPVFLTQVSKEPDVPEITAAIC